MECAMALPEDVYRHYYSLSHITPKEMGNLICDRDPRDGTLKYSHSEFKNTLQRISDAVTKRGDLTIVRDYSVNLPMDTRNLFLWACRAYTYFKPKLPVDMIVNYGTVNIPLLEFDVEASGGSIPRTLR